MAKQTVNIGTSPNKGDGDPLRSAFDKINDNFDELYPKVATLESVTGITAGTTITNDLIGSVFGSDSTMLVDGLNSKIMGPIDDSNWEAITRNGNIAITVNSGTLALQATTGDTDFIKIGQNTGVKIFSDSNIDLNTAGQEIKIGENVASGDVQIGHSSSQLFVNGTLTVNAFGKIQFPVNTTTERNGLAPSAGWVIYNSTTTQPEVYNGTSWLPMVVTAATVSAHQASLTITESQISDLQSYLTTETNDLSSAVVWANVPNANITQASVTQHQAALSIQESQISDLQSYITTVGPLSSHTNVSTSAPSDGNLLVYNNSANEWQPTSSLGDDIKINFGANNDLRIYHDSTFNNSVIDNATGHLILRNEPSNTSSNVYLQSDNDVLITSIAAGETFAKFSDDAGVELYHDDVKKFNTGSHGVDIVDEAHIEGATPHLTLKRTNNANVPTLRFKGSGGTIGASIDFDGTAGTSNELAFQTFDGASLAERFRVTYTGATVTGTLTLATPGTAPTANNDPGSQGEIRYDDNYLYIKTASGWKRANLSGIV